MAETIFSIICSLIALLGSCVSYYFYIRAKVYAGTESAVNEAEQTDKKGAEKMAFAVDQLYRIIPAALKPFFKRKYLEKIVQKAFEKIEEYAKKQVKKQ